MNTISNDNRATLPPQIRVQRLTAAYGETAILEEVSFEVYRGEVFIILGGSGCGKSTLLKHLIGLIRPKAGSVEIHGENYTQANAKTRKQIMRRFGVMYQSGALFGSLSLLENVRLPLEEFTDLPPEAIDLTGRMKLGRVGLADYADFMPSDISGGMRKRAAIARAMALDPEILFLDEPSAGLDPVTSAGLDQLIVRLARTCGITFVVVTHELDSIFAIADRVIMLDKNRKGIIAEGNPKNLRDHSDDRFVRAFFNRQPDAAKAEASSESINQ